MSKQVFEVVLSRRATATRSLPDKADRGRRGPVLDGARRSGERSKEPISGTEV